MIADKTCFSLFRAGSRINNQSLPSLVINNNIIKLVSNCKYLGIFIDDQLKFGIHVNHLCSKIVKVAGIFYKLRDAKLPLDALKNIYYAFIHPHILYDIEIYANYL